MPRHFFSSTISILTWWSSIQIDATTHNNNNDNDPQTNVVSTGQRRKMKGFGDFRRVAVVIVPSDEELKKRTDIQVEADNKIVSENAVNEMKGNMKCNYTLFGGFMF